MFMVRGAAVTALLGCLPVCFCEGVGVLGF